MRPPRGRITTLEHYAIDQSERIGRVPRPTDIHRLGVNVDLTEEVMASPESNTRIEPDASEHE